MVQHWRAAGMTYLKYSNHCASLVRRVLKPDVLAKQKKGADFEMLRAEWEGGKIVTRCTYLR